MDVLKLDSTRHISAVSQLDKNTAPTQQATQTTVQFKSVDLNEVDLNMVENATVQMKQSEDVDMSRVQALKEKIASGELDFSMHEVARALVRN